jgi:hypothetical protein
LALSLATGAFIAVFCSAFWRHFWPFFPLLAFSIRSDHRHFCCWSLVDAGKVAKLKRGPIELQTLHYQFYLGPGTIKK